MSHKGVFENPFAEYTKASADNILAAGHDAVSPKFVSKLEKFKEEKLQKLTTDLNNDIYDYTVYTGTAGTALLYYLYATRKNEVNHEMLLKALDYIHLDQLKGKRISFLCGDAGPLAIAAVISYKLGSRRPDRLSDYKLITKRLTDLILLLEDSPDELLYGRSGYLYALLFVNKHIGKEVIHADHLEKVVHAILKSGKSVALENKSECPLMWQWHDKVYIGAAHGVAGILYTLLQARKYLSAVEMRNFVKPTLEWLLGLRFPSGNFPSSLGSSSGDRLVQWCHGAPGVVPLCILASQVFDDERYLKIAQQCGEVVWQRGLSTKGYSLCHGVAGNAYAFLQLYRATKKPVHLYRACCFTEWCAVERPGTELHKPERPTSLFEGLPGRLYLAEDIIYTNDAKFPAFSL